jgi:kinesin family protein 5
LFQQLDNKDDEIREQTLLAKRLKEQVLEQEELISSIRRDYENLSQEMSKIQVNKVRLYN